MLAPNGIRGILFDFDGTLRHSQPDGGEVFIDQAIALGLPIGMDDRLRGIRWEHYYWANYPELRADLNTFGREGSEFWHNYGHRQLVSLGIPREQAGLLSPVLTKYMSEQYKPDSVLPREVPALLGQLKEAGFKLAVVSNREFPYQQELDQLGVSEYFDLLLAAGEVQSYKPEPGIFEAALQRMDLTPEAAMYVGDNYFADVVGSQRAGLRPVLYDPRGVYPHATCEVISSFDQLTGLFK